MNRLPFTPDFSAADPLRAWRRYATVFAVASARKQNIPSEARRLYGKEAGDKIIATHDAIIKAAVAPADTATAAWAGALVGTGVGPFLKSLRPRSAATRLFERAISVNFGDGDNVFSLPRLSANFPVPGFVAEGGAIPVVSGAFGSVLIGPPTKMAFIAVMTGEIVNYSAENAEQVVQLAMQDAAARGLDAVVFDAVAASATRPAGLLNGVTPIAATAGGGETAMAADIGNLVGAIGTAGGGASPVMIFANPRQAAVLQLRSGANLAYEVISTPALAVGTIVAIQPEAIASGFDGLPLIRSGTDAVLHMESATPLAIGTAGAPPTVAAPVLSVFQNDLTAIRLIQPTAWGARGAGFVQVINSATW
jgi:hypothetical protein